MKAKEIRIEQATSFRWLPPVGDLRVIGYLPPSPLKNKDQWTQDASDIVAHFIQMVGQLTNSAWYKADCCTYTDGPGIDTFTFCGLEPFVYAALCFRQLFEDQLAQKACEIYEKHANNAYKVQWMENELAAFKDALASDCMMFQNFSICTLIQTITYGSLLIHAPGATKAKNRERFKALMKHPRGAVIYSLDFDMRCLCSYLSGMAILMNREMANCQNTDSIPAPEVWWHSTLFVDTSKKAVAS